MKKAKKKRSILEEEVSKEIDLHTWQGRLFVFIIIIIVVVFIIMISQNTSSFYDWYPGKRMDDMKSATPIEKTK